MSLSEQMQPVKICMNLCRVYSYKTTVFLCDISALHFLLFQRLNHSFFVLFVFVFYHTG